MLTKGIMYKLLYWKKKKVELNFFITIDTQHLNESYLDHQWKKKKSVTVN